MFSAKRSFAETLPDGSGTGDCGRDRCRRPSVIHHVTAALSTADPKSASGIAASSRFHGAAMAGLGAGGGREQAPCCDCGIECNWKRGTGEVGGEKRGK